jgi:S-adenosylmethionine synthetase
MELTNEIVFRGHPDKVCDQIAGACVDDILAHDPEAHTGIECAVKDSRLWMFGEVRSTYKCPYKKIARRVLRDIGYWQRFKVRVNISHQSPDIAMGVRRHGAGDNGMMFGYATDETPERLPKAQVILQHIAEKYDGLVHKYPGAFYPDGKAEVTGDYDEAGNLKSVLMVTVCYSNPETMRDKTDAFIRKIVSEECSPEQIVINPTGAFREYGPWADSGLTGRKIVVDAYEGFAPVGGGSMNGKDPTKVDVSGAYMARKVAKMYVDQGHFHRVTAQVGYAIGVSEPISLYVTADGQEIEYPWSVWEMFRVDNVVKNMAGVKYEEAAKYGHYNN